jgi:hypothetical protein
MEEKERSKIMSLLSLNDNLSDAVQFVSNACLRRFVLLRLTVDSHKANKNVLRILRQKDSDFTC